MKERRRKMEGPTLERSMSAVVDRLTRAGWTHPERIGLNHLL
jgi:hypothetical protein